MRGSVLVKLLFAIVFICFANVAQAQMAQDKNLGDFRWTIAPYAWLTGISGTVGAKGYDANINVSFADLSKYLNLGAMVHAEVLYQERFGLFSDFNYSLLSDQTSSKRASLDAKMSLVLSDVVAFYRVGTIPLGKAQTSSMDFDLLGGARIWNLAVKLDAERDRGGRNVFAQKTWADPIVGARATFHLTDAWIMSLRGGIGGFSVSSALTWDTTALIGYTFWEHGTLLAGYRAVGVNYSEGSGKSAFKFDATLSGPILGVAFTF